MEILVLLKQVPATESMIAVADDGVSIKTDGLKYVINPYDELVRVLPSTRYSGCGANLICR